MPDLSLKQLISRELKQTSLYLATLWQMTLSNGTIIRVTSHDQSLQFGGHLYSPVAAFDTSARAFGSRLDPQNVSIEGPVSNVLVTEANLRAGIYRNALIVETIVDWRQPDRRVITTNSYIVREITWNGATWQADLDGVASQLDYPVGRYYTRTCSWDFGDSRCGVARSSQAVEVISVSSSPTLSFTVSPSLPANYAYGTLQWSTGSNAGVISEIRGVSGGGLSLQLPSPFPVQVGDTGTARNGCPKDFDSCGTLYNNQIRFGGFPFMPGTDVMIRTPDFEGR